MGWPEVLRKLGYRKPEITEDGDLYLPNSDRVVLNRIRYNKHQKIITRPAMRMRQPRAIIALTQYSHLTDAQKKEIRRIAADIQKRQSNHDMRLGVKSNKHYRYIARKNKIFI
ncbi:hypothetical protein GNI_021600 [Gregarina niphandrodes]|uniref:Uncharacterized protein n=1 Tax=Gregarina niphandrodes TaxID=110365 RepID=A0A023BBP7_GRENI|nr:hypothetical protein GNI_021600 [Gregarina niphandrodes]EZG80324.1 hypothetical protein GNI_021600 [Gregarina niphandrodes]|eukprot:XP_011134298.1 hypothetical protein GNI_021600 [Gregarina niphandrodes]